MSSTAKQQQPAPELRQWLRRLLGGVCVVTTFFSAFFAATSLLITGQFLNDEIPPGRIESIRGHAKTGPRLRLDNGHEVVFTSQVLHQQRRPVQLAVGDHVEKRRGSFAYVVNGTALTDVRWVLRDWLLPAQLLVPLAAYLLVGAGYVLVYGSTPFGDLVWSGEEQKRPRRPRTRGGMILAVFASWLVAALLLTTVFGCVAGCLSGVGNALRG